MINWIITNKEWIFSGIGVVIITGIIGILKGKEKSKDNIKMNQKSGKNSSNIQIGQLSLQTSEDVLHEEEQNIKVILEEEIKENLTDIISIKNQFENIKFNFLDILTNIDQNKFEPGNFCQPLLIKLNTEQYDKFEGELIKYSSEESKSIIRLYAQFKLWNKKEDLCNFSKEEYAQFRKVLLFEFNKYEIHIKE